MKISAAIICKNEEACIERMLKSVKDFDEIIVVDTGSTDGTLEIVKKYTDKIYHFEWCDDFSKARNEAISKCTGDWILSIDSDHELLSSADKVREEAQKAEDAKVKVAKIKSKVDGSEAFHYREVLFKNDPEVKWVGKVHECITPVTTYIADVERTVGYSINHSLDKDRNLRILLDSEKTPRVMFYLGREYYEKKQYEESIRWMTSYILKATWIPEIAEAYLVLAKCYYSLNNWTKSRYNILMAINANPNFKEAFILMSKVSYDKYKQRWLDFAKLADNTNVLFIR